MWGEALYWAIQSLGWLGGGMIDPVRGLESRQIYLQLPAVRSYIAYLSKLSGSSLRKTVLNNAQYTE